MLHHRNISTTSVCAFCSAQDDWKHALIDCVMARSVWSLCSEETMETMLDNLSLDAKKLDLHYARFAAACGIYTGVGDLMGSVASKKESDT